MNIKKNLALFTITILTTISLTACNNNLEKEDIKQDNEQYEKVWVDKIFDYPDIDNFKYIQNLIGYDLPLTMDKVVNNTNLTYGENKLPLKDYFKGISGIYENVNFEDTELKTQTNYYTIELQFANKINNTYTWESLIQDKNSLVLEVKPKLIVANANSDYEEKEMQLDYIFKQIGKPDYVFFNDLTENQEILPEDKTTNDVENFNKIPRQNSLLAVYETEENGAVIIKIRDNLSLDESNELDSSNFSYDILVLNQGGFEKLKKDYSVDMFPDKGWKTIYETLIIY